jgi:hypothetical protein
MMLRHVKRWKFSPEPAVQKAPALAVGLRVGRLGFALGHASLKDGGIGSIVAPLFIVLDMDSSVSPTYGEQGAMRESR